MTTMNSDSESQDSDDGRRFRFEATRKDSVAPIETADKTKTPKKKSKHKSSHCESRHYRTDRLKERLKHESNRNTDDKDLKYSEKHSKHESKSSRQEDGRNSHKDYREGRDASATNGRGYRNSNEGDVREKISRDSKRQSDRDRSIHQMQRTREHSYERNHHNERAFSEKYKSRYHERHKHHSRDRSRDRSHHSSRSIRSSNGDYRSREDQGRHDTCKKISVRENRSQDSRDYSKNIEGECSYNEACSSENTKEDSSIEIQDCKDLDLSQFDILSETGENISDGRDSASRMSSPCSRKIKLKRHDFEDQSENFASTKRENNSDEANEEKQLKVKRRNYDLASSSTNNNPSAVSDSTSSATFLVTRETLIDSVRKKTSEHYKETRMLINPDSERSNLEEKYLQCLDSLDETQLLGRNREETEFVYGPLLPPKSSSNIGITVGDKLEKTSLNSPNENKIDNNDKTASFIGPCLPPRLNNDYQNGKQEDAEDAVMIAMEADIVFGPALPPHLLQRQQSENDSQDKIIGPVLPDTVNSHKETSIELSDDDYAIGPLPVDHPALRNSRVHEQLDLRAQKIKHEGYLAETDLGNKREEWMTELPPAQAANLGLGPRKFRLRDGPDMSDRSCWTDTPAQKAQKQRDSKIKRLGEPDTEHVKEFHRKDINEKRKSEKSLLEMHQSKIAKKKKKEEKEAKQSGISMRRPFDRDIDLQVNRLDQTQKKTILMKAQLLDDRFSRGQI